MHDKYCTLYLGTVKQTVTKATVISSLLPRERHAINDASPRIGQHEERTVNPVPRYLSEPAAGKAASNIESEPH